jgi:hypothetical protein
MLVRLLVASRLSLVIHRAALLLHVTRSYLLYSTAFHPISKVTPCTHDPVSIPTRPIPSLFRPRSSSRAQQSRAEQSRLSSKNPSTVHYTTVQPHPHPLAPQVIPRFHRCNLHLTSDHQASALMHDTRTCMLLHGADYGHVELGQGKTRLKWCAHRLPWVCSVDLAGFGSGPVSMASLDRIRRGEVR